MAKPRDERHKYLFRTALDSNPPLTAAYRSNV